MNKTFLIVACMMSPLIYGTNETRIMTRAAHQQQLAKLTSEKRLAEEALPDSKSNSLLMYSLYASVAMFIILKTDNSYVEAVKCVPFLGIGYGFGKLIKRLGQYCTAKENLEKYEHKLKNPEYEDKEFNISNFISSLFKWDESPSGNVKPKRQAGRSRPG